MTRKLRHERGPPARRRRAEGPNLGNTARPTYSPQVDEQGRARPKRRGDCDGYDTRR